MQAYRSEVLEKADRLERNCSAIGLGKRAIALTINGKTLHDSVERLPSLLGYEMKIKEQKQRGLEALDEFTGTKKYYRYNPQRFPNVVLTEGVRFLAETAECFWLIDEIASLQQHPNLCKHPQLQEIQFWTLRVHGDESAILTCEWDSNEVVYQQAIRRTDFPLSIQTLWVCTEDGFMVIMLPSEY